MSEASGHGTGRNADPGEPAWDVQLQAIEQRMARRRRDIRRAWGVLEQQTDPLRWVRSALVPGALGLAGGALLALLWRRGRPGPSEGRRSRRGQAAEARHHHHPGLGAVLVAAAWPLVRQLVQPAIERATEAQLAALAERWLRPRAAPRHAEPSSGAMSAAPRPHPDAPGKT